MYNNSDYIVILSFLVIVRSRLLMIRLLSFYYINNKLWALHIYIRCAFSLPINNTERNKAQGECLRHCKHADLREEKAMKDKLKKKKEKNILKPQANSSSEGKARKIKRSKVYNKIPAE